MAKLLFNRLTILGLVAAMMFFFNPAITQGYEEEPLAGEETETWFEEDGVELDDSGGLFFQYTWVPASAFVATYPGNLDLKFDGTRLTMYRNAGSNLTNGAMANIRLPSGASLFQIQWHYIDTIGGGLTFFGYRVPFNGTLQSLYSSSSSVNGGTVATKTVNAALRTIANRDNLYYAWLNFNRIGTSAQLRGARLFWQRQIRSGLPNPFSDIGFLPAVFQDAIKALAASGITGGCGGTQYCPSDNVTRAQMALFLARALGLYWAGSSGF